MLEKSGQDPKRGLQSKGTQINLQRVGGDNEDPLRTRTEVRGVVQAECEVAILAIDLIHDFSCVLLEIFELAKEPVQSKSLGIVPVGCN